MRVGSIAAVFEEVNRLKAAARARGEDIIDFGMGNPDMPTPPHIVEKLIETARDPDQAFARGRMHGRQRMTHGVRFDDAAFLHQCLASLRA